MVRSNQEMERIEDKAARQVTFSKRKKGLVKKLYELSVLCDIDVALIASSPSGRLSQFSGRKRTEEVLTRYMNLTDEEREEVIQNREYWIKTLNQIMSEDDKELQLSKAENVNPQIEELQVEVDTLQQQLQIAEEQLRVFEPALSLEFMSMGELESMEEQLLNSLENVLQRKEHFLANPPSYYHEDPSSSEGRMLAYFENQVTNGPPAPWDLSCTTGAEYPLLLQGSSSKMGERSVNDPDPENFPIWSPTSPFLFPPIQLQDEAEAQSKAAGVRIPPDEACSGEADS